MCNTKFSLNQKVKAINGCGDAAPYNGQIGTIVGFNINRPALCQVQFRNGGLCWVYDHEIEPVQETSRPKVGDAVIFHRQLLLDGKQYQGEIGIVEKDDGSGVPFFVRITPDYAGWFKPNEISLTPKQHQIFAKLKPGMRVKSTRNGWLIVMPICMASTKTDCEFVLWNTEGCCNDKDSILDELKYATAVYNAPKSFHDAFNPHKHGGEIVWDVSQYVDPIEAEKQRQRDDIKKQIAELEKQLTTIK